MKGRGGPLSYRSFRLLFAARTISFFGTNLAPIAVAFGVLDLTGSASYVGLSFAAWTLAQVSTLLVGGVVADRLPRRVVMIASDGANLCVRATMGALLLSGHAGVWELIALQAAGGAATAFYSPASTGLVPETVPARHLQQANGLMSIARYVAFPVGAAAGAAIVTGEAIGSLAGGVVGLRLRPHRAMVVIGALFTVTALQSALLAEHAPYPTIAVAAAFAGFAFSYGTVIWDTSLQQQIAPEKLSRVSAYNWMGAMAFLPAGYALAGPLADLVGMSTYLWVGAVWVVVTTLAVICVRGVREFRLAPAEAPHDAAVAVGT